MRTFSFSSFLVFLFLLFSGLREPNGTIIVKKSKIYVLAIGVDSTNVKSSEPNGYFTNVSSKYAAKDAYKLSSYFSLPIITLKKKLPQGGDHSVSSNGHFFSALEQTSQSLAVELRYDTINTYTLTNSAATYQNVKAAFDSISKKINGNDIFIFYYAGPSGRAYSEKLKNEIESGEMVFFPLFDKVELNNDTLDNVHTSLNSINLKNYFNNIGCKRQLMIFDTNYGEKFFKTFSSYVFEKDPAVASLIDRDRSYIFNVDNTLETARLGGGVLTHNLTQMRKSELKFLFSGNATDKFYFEKCFAGQQSSLFQSDSSKDFPQTYSAVRYERDYLDFLKSFQWKNDLSRGNQPFKEEKKVNTTAGIKYALLIGTDIYDSPSWQKLNNPVHDASVIENELRTRYDFKTELLKNPTRKEILEALRHYKTKIQYDSTSQLFLFIAGHGGLDDFVNGFIATKDSKSAEEDFPRDTYITHSQLRDIVNSIDCQHIMVVLDVCFGGTFDEKLGSSTDRSEVQTPYKDADQETFIKRRLKHKSRLYITSGGKEYVPDGRPGMHSPFAFKFIDALRSKAGKDNILTYSELKSNLEKVIPEPRTGIFGSSEPGGDFLFIGKI